MTVDTHCGRLEFLILYLFILLYSIITCHIYIFSNILCFCHAVQWWKFRGRRNAPITWRLAIVSLVQLVNSITHNKLRLWCPRLHLHFIHRCSLCQFLHLNSIHPWLLGSSPGLQCSLVHICQDLTLPCCSLQELFQFRAGILIRFVRPLLLKF